MGRQTPGRPKLSRDGTVTPTLDELGINRNQASRCQKIASIDEERFEEHIACVKAYGAQFEALYRAFFDWAAGNEKAFKDIPQLP